MPAPTTGSLGLSSIIRRGESHPYWHHDVVLPVLGRDVLRHDDSDEVRVLQRDADLAFPTNRLQEVHQIGSVQPKLFGGSEKGDQMEHALGSGRKWSSPPRDKRSSG